MFLKTNKSILFFAFLFCASCYDVELNCKDFKTGKFKFETKVNGVTKTTYFDRNDSIEIENYEGKIDTSTIRWVNDCEYILKKKHPKSSADEKAIDVRILSTTKKSYLFEFGWVGNEQKKQGKAEKVILNH